MTFWRKIKNFFRGPDHRVGQPARYAHAIRRVSSVRFIWAKGEWRFQLGGDPFVDFNSTEIWAMRAELALFLKQRDCADGRPAPLPISGNGTPKRSGGG